MSKTLKCTIFYIWLWKWKKWDIARFLNIKKDITGETPKWNTSILGYFDEKWKCRHMTKSSFKCFLGHFMVPPVYIPVLPKLYQYKYWIFKNCNINIENLINSFPCPDQVLNHIFVVSVLIHSWPKSRSNQLFVCYVANWIYQFLHKSKWN